MAFREPAPVKGLRMPAETRRSSSATTVATEDEHKRKIEIRYYDRKGETVRISRGIYPASCMDRAFMHMRRDDYGAKTCDVYNGETGKLWGNIAFTHSRGVEVLFKEDPKSGDRPEPEKE